MRNAYVRLASLGYSKKRYKDVINGDYDKRYLANVPERKKESVSKIPPKVARVKRAPFEKFKYNFYE
jgi:hypothetical protein